MKKILVMRLKERVEEGNRKEIEMASERRDREKERTREKKIRKDRKKQNRTVTRI